MRIKLLIAISILLALCACEFPEVETIGCDVSELIDAINDANATPATGDNIALSAGCIYELTAVDNSDTLGNNGLPVIESPIAIIGNGATIRRSTGAGTPLFRIFKVSLNGDLLLQNVTLANGAASPADDTGNLIGGAISNQGVVTVSSSNFLNNQADLGGAIRNFRGDVTVAGSTFSNNLANHSGGAVYNQGGNLDVSNSQFDGNTATSGRGGAINNGDQEQASIAAIMGSTFTGNVAFAGGGIGNELGGFMTIDDSSFFSNQASRGGAIYNKTEMDVHTTTIANNTAYSGGGIQSSGSILYISNSTLSGNSLISAPGPDEQGSAIIHDSGRLNVGSATITGNSASANRPAVYVQSGWGVGVGNSIVAMNIGGDCDFSSSSVMYSIGGDNIDSDGSCTGFTITDDPLLGPLADNGGPTQTHALLPGSPAIDTSTLCPHPTDQRGVTRPQGSDYDIGAFELEAFSPVVEISPVVTLEQALPIETPTPTEEEPPRFSLDMNGFCRRGPNKRYED
ncbi:MAG: choice-of-anchor Q domain-containing protein, partial [Anaerolineales bacterium]